MAKYLKSSCSRALRLQIEPKLENRLFSGSAYMAIKSIVKPDNGDYYRH